MRASERVFRRMFRERTEHVACLLAVTTAAWRDSTGYVLIEVVIARRSSSAYEWTADEPQTSIHRRDTEAQAIRDVIALHDLTCTTAFAADEAACRSEG